MWSDKKYINITIDVLIFLLVINIFHIGQFALPIICLILYIDNGFKLNIINHKIFILLCLFGATFFVFSYKLGFYSTMGFCVPLAYYIGTNVKYPTEKNIKKLIYIIAFAMAGHVVLNFGRDLYAFGLEYATSYFHYDIWTNEKIKETITAINFIPLIGCLYFLVIYEKDKKFKVVGIMLLVTIFIYNIGLGRRTPVLMLAVSIFISLFFDFVIFKSSKKSFKTILIVLFCLLIPVIFVFLVLLFNLFGLREWLMSIKLIFKFISAGLQTERIEIFIQAVKLMPYHIFGGQEISNIIGMYVHDLWLDTYDFAGIFPYVLLIIYSLNCIYNVIRVYRNKAIKDEYKLLFILVFIVIVIQMFFDPIMTGSSIFLISSVIIFGGYETLNNYYEKSSK